MPLSLAMHAAALAAVVVFATGRPDASTESPATFHLVAELEVDDDPLEVSRLEAESIESGKASGRAGSVKGTARSQVQPTRQGRDTDQSPPTEPEAVAPAHEPALEPATEQAPVPQSGSVVGDLDGALAASRGLGIGRGGNGRGDGSGAGSGRGRARYVDRGPLPAADKPSLARPARLIYPNRDRETRENRLFIVVLNVDAKGYVSGVRLKKGLDFHSNGKALDAVWRFRYDPARDKEGKPIASMVTQKFMLNW